MFQLFFDKLKKSSAYFIRLFAKSNGFPYVNFDPPLKNLDDQTNASKYRCVSLGLCRRVGHGVNALWEVSFTLFYSNAAVEAGSAQLSCGAI